ncbi:hypothetical protein OF83DRAFT_1128387, partial [Amylostereum chailletii]
MSLPQRNIETAHTKCRICSILKVGDAAGERGMFDVRWAKQDETPVPRDVFVRARNAWQEDDIDDSPEAPGRSVFLPFQLYFAQLCPHLLSYSRFHPLFYLYLPFTLHQWTPLPPSFLTSPPPPRSRPSSPPPTSPSTPSTRAPPRARDASSPERDPRLRIDLFLHYWNVRETQHYRRLCIKYSFFRSRRGILSGSWKEEGGAGGGSCIDITTA